MRRGIRENRFTTKMQKKLVVLFVLVLSAFVGLSVRLILINRDNGEQYKRQVLSQQRYDSRTLPFKRGDIVDCKGTKLAVSEKVYNVILDANQISGKEECISATTDALGRCFHLDTGKVREYIAANPNSQYYVLARKLSYDDISPFVKLQENVKKNPNIKGIWFEEEYERVYPNGSLACDVIGFTGKDNTGTYGLEEYYNDTLNGINGREYGYLNDDSTLERTTRPAVDGNTIVSTIDVNIQNIVEKYIRMYNEDNRDAYREGNGAENVGCIIMRANTGEVLAMASYPDYNLNDVYNPDVLLGTVKLDANGKPTEEIVTKETINAMDEDTLYANLNSVWKNFCICSTYEPGSVAKPFTVAAGLESGRLNGTETYFCGGSLWKGGHEIHCHNRLGDGMLTVQEAIEKSCNVALMQMGETIGKSTFLQFQQMYNWGLRTNIDLAGEARTASLVYNDKTMGEAELATSTFGQGFNATMIQMIAAYCSLVNGGYYYEPHMVSKIVSSDGTTIANIEPRVLKQTVSASTSAKIIQYCNGVVANGTGKTARPAGYAIGGKTGTAEMSPRNKKNYVVSFMGYAPAENPEIVIYAVVDRPNTRSQDDAKFATGIVRNVLSEVLPYLNCFMTEELSDQEKEELSQKGMNHGQEEEQEENGEEKSGEEERDDLETVEIQGADLQQEQITEEEKAWKERISSYEIDGETGYLIEPETGVLIDPATGQALDGASFMN